ncbi:hypothetical protein [Peribacillus muralis]|uniref:hypothetical protein n=1 Tax=Peribacillus muralis TaxID=264697 RepID=UPI00366B17CA
MSRNEDERRCFWSHPVLVNLYIDRFIALKVLPYSEIWGASAVLAPIPCRGYVAYANKSRTLTLCSYLNNRRIFFCFKFNIVSNNHH